MLLYSPLLSNAGKLPRELMCLQSLKELALPGNKLFGGKSVSRVVPMAL